MDKGTIFVIFAILFELLIATAVVWGILHEKLLISWEDAIAAKIRKKIRIIKRALLSKWLAGDGLIVRPLTSREKEWQQFENTLGIKELSFWPEMGTKTLFPPVARALMAKWLAADDLTVRAITPRELNDAIGFLQDYIIDNDIHCRQSSRMDYIAPITSMGVNDLLEIINRGQEGYYDKHMGT